MVPPEAKFLIVAVRPPPVEMLFAVTFTVAFEPIVPGRSDSDALRGLTGEIARHGGPVSSRIRWDLTARAVMFAIDVALTPMLQPLTELSMSRNRKECCRSKRCLRSR